MSKFVPIVTSAYRPPVATRFHCGSCRYWRQLGNTIGECRVRSPQILIVPGYQAGAGGSSYPQPTTIWPRTKPDDDCGEHQL